MAYTYEQAKIADRVSAIRAMRKAERKLEEVLSQRGKGGYKDMLEREKKQIELQAEIKETRQWIMDLDRIIMRAFGEVEWEKKRRVYMDGLLAWDGGPWAGY